MAKKKKAEEDHKFVKLIKKLKGLGDRKFKIQETEFSVTKLPIMEQFDMSEEIRITMAETANKFENNEGSDADNASLFFKTILGLPPPFVKDLRDKMFEHIQFQGGKSGVEKGWAPLANCEDAAFQDFEVVHIYEVLGRALYVNFSGSFSGIMSAIPGAEKLIKQLNLET